jgi:uncharacterized Zn finger protein
MTGTGWAEEADETEEPFWRAAPPARARRVEGGIKINAPRGPVARTWWSSRFLAVVEAAGLGGRMARGRTYARQGQTVSLTVRAGAATAAVQGSAARPYRVRIGVPTLGKAQWTAVLDALAADASLTAALLAGELPREVEDVFAAQGLPLFPAGPGDLAMDCTCPDLAVPCKHLAAVFYLLVERFDADPFAVLALRGRDRETLLAHLRERRRTPEPDADAGLPLDPAEFYGAFHGAPPPTLPLGPPTPPDALLDQVPPLPLTVRGRPVTDLLRPLYRALRAEGAEDPAGDGASRTSTPSQGARASASS